MLRYCSDGHHIATMKCFVILVAISMVYTGHASPIDIEETIPKDNRHYVEGESRYIWMPDGDGNLHLVDLFEPVEEISTLNGAQNQYWLYTRQNPQNAQIITHGNANTIWGSNYNGARPLIVIVHGWNSNGNSDLNPAIRDAILSVQDCNVIVVDWRNTANTAYTLAVFGVPSVGQHLGNFLTWLINTAGGNWNNVHLVGFSLGAHVVGNAGRTAGRRAARITGLDPAGPQWGGNGNALNANDGLYVEAIHTNGGALGINDPIGQTNFYPNGGRNMPGCGVNIACSHGRAHEYFASSIRTNHLVGRQCANLADANANRCTGNAFNMGNGAWSKNGWGFFAMTTGSNWPF